MSENAVKELPPMGISHPLVGKVEKLPIGDLKVVPAEFQVRNLNSNNVVAKTLQSIEAQDAVGKMRELVLAGKLLDPIIVWTDRSTGETVVIDGHHRMEAYSEADVAPAIKVWVQQLKVDTAKEARKFAFDRNSRINLTMSPAECLNEAWLAVLTGEATGSLREIAATYNVSKSSVERMRKEAEEVQKTLQVKAAGEGEDLDVGFIRQNAPLWKELAQWRDGEDAENPDLNKMDQKKIDSLVRSMAVRLGKDMLARPDLVREAFAQFHEQVLGKQLTMQVEESGEFEGGEGMDF